MNNYIAGFGGVNLDIHIRSRERVLMRDSNPAEISTSAGGVMHNILANLALLGRRCVFLSAIGRDAFGEMLMQSLEDFGIERSEIYESAEFPSSRYADFSDETGDMLVAANDMKIIENLPQSYLEEKTEVIRGAALFIVDANPKEERIEQAVSIAGSANVPVFADTVSAAKCERLLPVIGKLSLLKPNLLELERLSGMPCGSRNEIERAAEKLLESGLEKICVSLGKNGCFYADRDGERIFRNLRPAEKAENTTGAGDAFMAGLAEAHCRGLDTKEMLEYALTLGICAVTSRESVNKNLSEEFINRTLQKYKIC